MSEVTGSSGEMETENFFSKLRFYGLVLGLYLLVTILLTYPVLFRMGISVPGYLDVYQVLNYLWYNHAVVFYNQGSTLAHNSLLFWPNGISQMAFSSAFNQVLAIILLSFLSLPSAYTILWLSTFVISAFGAFLLVHYLTDNSIAAFIAGIAFAFSPFHFVHAQGHLGAMTISWIPFCALFLIKMYRETSLKYSVIAGFFCVLVGLSDLQYFVFMGLFVFTLLLFEIWVKCLHNHVSITATVPKIFKKYVIFGMVALIGILPFVLGDVLVATSTANYLLPQPAEASLYSADLLGFFLPSLLHPVFGMFTAPIYQGFTGNYWENTTFIGFTILGLSIFAVWKLRNNVVVLFWSLIAVLFSVFSLGPILHVAGKSSITVFNFILSIPLPYTLLVHVVPFLENSRTPGRLFVIASLAFSVLAGYGICQVIKSSKKQKYLFSAIICGLIIFEFLSVPVMLSPLDQPAFYQNISSDHDVYGLLEIPASENYYAGVKIEYYQTIHGKPIVGGQVGRMPSGSRDFETNSPLIRELSFPEIMNQDILDQNAVTVGNSILEHYNIRYIVLHKDFLSNDQLNKDEAFLSECDPVLPKIYEDNTLVVFGQNTSGLTPQFFVLGTGWGGLENWTGTATRWIEDDATVFVYAQQNRTSHLSMRAYSLEHENILDLSLSDGHTHQVIVPEGYETISLPVDLHQGENVFRFSVPGPCYKPGDIPGVNNPDSRCLGIAIQNISFS